jgi:hypothetical protein
MFAADYSELRLRDSYQSLTSWPKSGGIMPPNSAGTLTLH